MRFKGIGAGTRKRVAVSELVATLMLIAIAVVAAVILFGFVSGLFSNFQKGGPSYLVTANGQMAVPGSTDVSGILSITLRDEGSQAIIGIAISCSSPPFITASCVQPPSPPLILDYSGAAISAANPLPVNALAEGSAGVTAAGVPGFTAGTTYQVLVTATFLGGSTQIIVISVTSTS